jgi:hypothetical protein
MKGLKKHARFLLVLPLLVAVTAAFRPGLSLRWLATFPATIGTSLLLA